MKVGDSWNGWKIDSLIGEGSFGRVYKVTREEFGYHYESALKVIRMPQSKAEERAVRDEVMNDQIAASYFREMAEDIVREVALMSELRGNSNIVSYEDHAIMELEDEFGWEIFIRMEKLTPLSEYLRTHTFTIRDVIRMGIDLCKALEICQRYNIIHRDIKPANIFVSKQDDFKLGDFGIARQMDRTQTEVSRKGTFSYMAPEVIKSQKYNSSVDIYSLGLVLYRFLNNNRGPFMPPYPEQIKYEDKQNANNLRINGAALEPPCNAKGRLAEIVLKACAYEPKDRYASPAEMRKDLESIACTDEEVRNLYPSGDELELISGSTDGHSEVKETAGPNAMDETVALFDLTQNEKANPAETTDDNSGTATKGTKKGGKGAAKYIAAAVFIVMLTGVGLWLYFFHCEVPDVAGNDVTWKTAKGEIEEAGLEYAGTKEFSKTKNGEAIYRRGTVMKQKPAAGEYIKRGSKVSLVISKGKPISVPSLKGKKKVDASEELEKLGLSMVASGKKEYSDTIKKNRVIRQNPKAKTICEEGDEITVVLSKGITQVEVPDVIGKTTEEAKKLLEDAKFKVQVNKVTISGVTPGTIYWQSEEAGSKTDIYSQIEINEAVAPVYRSSGSKSRKKSSSSGGSSGPKVRWD